MNTQEKLTTKVTRLGNGLYGCRVFSLGKLIVELRVPKQHIQLAFRDMFRTLDKLSIGSNMAHASRLRKAKEQDVEIYRGYKYIWY